MNDNTVVWTLTYDYQYNSDFAATNHQFWEAGARKRLVIPNKITVRSHESHIPQYSGSATDATDFALIPIERTSRMRLESNAQATNIAQAGIDRIRADAEQMALLSPPNVGQEVWDLVRVTDNRIGSGTVRIANVRTIEVNFTPGSFQTRLRFGGGPANAPLRISNVGIGEATFNADVVESFDRIVEIFNIILPRLEVANSLALRNDRRIVSLQNQLLSLSSINTDDATFRNLRVTGRFVGTAEEL